MRTCHTLPELVPGYVRVGVPKSAAVSYIVSCHLLADSNPGRGMRAARRSAALEAIRQPDRPFVPPHAPEALIFDSTAESRTYNRQFPINPHE
jgi:hypothetical protein